MKFSRAVTPSARPKRRGALLIFLLPILLGAGYCTKKVTVPSVLPIKANLPAAALLEQINRQAKEESLQARITLDFEDFAQESNGTKRQIPTANGLLVMKRPQNIRLLVEAPIFSVKIADMVSDGEAFKVAIHWPSSSKQFLIGRNNKDYGRVQSETKTNNADIQRAGALANIRPQHLTDAILIKPIEASEKLIYFTEEAAEIEADSRPNAKKGAQIERPYYVLTLLERDSEGQAQLSRKFWFDRSQDNAPLLRQQIFNQGAMVADVHYSEFFTVGNLRLPKKVFIRRRGDLYAVTVTFKPDSVQINNEIPATAFDLTNENNLPEVNLDKDLKKSDKP